MSWTGKITNAGRTLLQQWALGGTLNITKASGGSGTSQSLETMTALTNPVQQLSIVERVAVQAGSQFKIQVAAHTSAYTMTQVGLFAKLNSGAETLLAIFQNTAGVSIEDKTVTPDFFYSLYATVATGSSGTLEVTFDLSAAVTQSSFREAIEPLADAVDELKESVLVSRNVSVPVSSFVADSAYDANGYNFRADIPLSGCTSDFVPTVVFQPADALSDNYAPFAAAGTDKVSIYAHQKPSAAVTVTVAAIKQSV